MNDDIAYDLGPLPESTDAATIRDLVEVLCADFYYLADQVRSYWYNPPFKSIQIYPGFEKQFPGDQKALDTLTSFARDFCNERLVGKE